jgi:hypothetical protein
MRGDGSLLVDGGYISITTPGTALKTVGGMMVSVCGEDSYGNIGADGGGTGLDADGDVMVLYLGAITADGDGSVALKTTGSVYVEGGGYVRASGDRGIAIVAGSDVTVDSGEAEGSGAGSIAIYAEGEAQIEVWGESHVFGRGAAIVAKRADGTIGDESLVETTGVLMYANGWLQGNAVVAKNVSVRDHAQVRAFNGAAIFLSGSLDISGGAVFGYGVDIGGASFVVTGEEELGYVDYLLNVIFRTASLDVVPGVEYAGDPGSIAGVGGDGIVLAWDFSQFYEEYLANDANPFPYVAGDTTDIIANSAEGASYSWAGGRRIDSIWYCRGDNEGYIPIDFNKINKPLKPKPSPEPDDGTDPGGGTGTGGSGTDPGTDPDTGGGTDPGTDPDTGGGTEPITDPGENKPAPKKKPGKGSGPGGAANPTGYSGTAWGARAGGNQAVAVPAATDAQPEPAQASVSDSDAYSGDSGEAVASEHEAPGFAGAQDTGQEAKKKAGPLPFVLGGAAALAACLLIVRRFRTIRQ